MADPKFERYEAAHRTLCPKCGENLVVRRSAQCRPCANRARIGLHAGDANPNWKGGFTYADGYKLVRVPGEYRPSGAPKYQGEHAVVWEAANGPLPQGYVVHHLNGDKLDNRIENLAAMPRHRHHSEPRDALKPYEAKIARLEYELFLSRNRIV